VVIFHCPDNALQLFAKAFSYGYDAFLTGSPQLPFVFLKHSLHEVTE